jgi:hypothetical protein
MLIDVIWGGSRGLFSNFRNTFSNKILINMSESGDSGDEWSKTLPSTRRAGGAAASHITPPGQPAVHSGRAASA